MSIREGARAGIAAGRIAARRVLNRVLPWAALTAVAVWLVTSRYGWGYYATVLATAVAIGLFGGFYAIKVKRDILAQERAEEEREQATGRGSARS